MVWSASSHIAYLILQDFLILHKGENLDGKAFEERRNHNPLVTHNRVEDGDVAVFQVLAAKQEAYTTESPSGLQWRVLLSHYKLNITRLL